MNAHGVFEYRPLEESSYYQVLKHKDDYEKSTKIFTNYISRLYKYCGEEGESRLKDQTYIQFMRMFESIKQNGLSYPQCPYKKSNEVLLFGITSGLKLHSGKSTCIPKNPHKLKGLAAFDGQHRLSILKFLDIKKIYGIHGLKENWPKFTILNYE